jgi:hypothetical protein
MEIILTWVELARSAEGIDVDGGSDSTIVPILLMTISQDPSVTETMIARIQNGGSRRRSSAEPAVVSLSTLTRGVAGNSGVCSSTSEACSVTAMEGPETGGGALIFIAPTRCTDPANIDRNLMNCVAFNPISGSVKKLDAMIESNRGERPNSAMLVPEAMPRWFGKFFDAAKSEEKYENTVPNPAIKKKAVRRWNEVDEGCVISAGVLVISQENRPNPRKKRKEDMSEQAQGP